MICRAVLWVPFSLFAMCMSDEYDLGECREMVSIIRDRIQAAIDTGASLDQIKAARPTADYDTRFAGADMFVEAGFTSLKQTPNRNVVQ